MKHIVQVVVDVLPSFDKESGHTEESYLLQELAWIGGDNMNLCKAQYQRIYLDHEEFVTEFARRMKEFYLHPENEIEGFSGCVEGVWFQCFIQENYNQMQWDDNQDYSYRDLYSIKVNAYNSFQDYESGNELENLKGGMIHFFSEENIEDFIKNGIFDQACRIQGEDALTKIFI